MEAEFDQRYNDDGDQYTELEATCKQANADDQDRSQSEEQADPDSDGDFRKEGKSRADGFMADAVDQRGAKYRTRDEHGDPQKSITCKISITGR